MDDTQRVGEDPEYLGSTRLQWPDLEHGPWDASLYWCELEGRLECVGLTLWHGVDPGAHTMADRVPGSITATNVRELGIADLIATARAKRLELDQDLVRQSPRWTFDVHQRVIANQRPTVKRAGPGKQLGRPTYTMEHWTEVAATYRELFRRGSPSPTADVAVHYEVDYSTAAKWISRCRNQYELLPKTTQGKAKAKEAT